MAYDHVLRAERMRPLYLSDGPLPPEPVGFHAPVGSLAERRAKRDAVTRAARARIQARAERVTA